MLRAVLKKVAEVTPPGMFERTSVKIVSVISYDAGSLPQCLESQGAETGHQATLDAVR
jgi:hypothetical protein